ncbi:GNAT family N-acetyltransferase [Oerskovia turbata]|uniref:GNAT family N-acetyltransferase n=1 Tax=Oerskovia turbata TaxID=1713 RepID=A0A4Q1L1V6_9CELL|nr:GNAT family N-acetyltransferase [Oerskovia turbata]RXR26925.1 GNAT family N-acetyltransferase [Oerskovia turbata]RXR36233.1 GNAT family N-acetyltransferase [Oerskovia turbata]TGJ94706.1 GNAT family N-acetyltransferase [Actinotalea fermentans ATCC 43279 = JCM 9966 = DSM 3133]
MTTIRPLLPTDLDALVDLSLRAWEPVYDSWRAILGERIYRLAYPDWRRSQAETVRSTCSTHAATSFVAEAGGRVVGFATVVLGEPDLDGRRAGDVELVAVDPSVQRAGVGRALMDASLGLMREAGCAYASVWTGGDDGHEPARAMYEASGFTALPLVHYYREL